MRRKAQRVKMRKRCQLRTQIMAKSLALMEVKIKTRLKEMASHLG